MTREYLAIIKDILRYGKPQECRNGNQLIIPHTSFTLSFSKGKEEAKLKLRKMYWKGIDGEFKTLIDPRPLKNISQFKANGCNYWHLWSTTDGSINIDYHNMMHPRLSNLMDEIKDDNTSRRHVINLWDQDNIDNGSLSLPCCWHNLTFSIISNTLHMTWTQRSCDVMIGLPSDIYLAYLFMEYIAKETNLAIGSCMFSLSNVHIYSEHIANAKVLLDRTEADFNNTLAFKLKE